jgi:ABC-2 type transport system permease protein
MTAIAQSTYMTQRHGRALLRQPWYVAMTLIHPIIWLVLFGQLFRSVAEIPGFTASATYLDYLVPGVVAMTAFFGASWSGMGMIEDIDRGILDRFLTSPTHRSSLIAGRLVHEGIQTVIQSAIIIGLAWLLGARLESGPIGVAALIGVAVVLAAIFGALSNALALVLRQRESVIGANQFFGLPLTFMSAAFMPLTLVPDWIATVARFNPLNWAVEAGREALMASPDWGFVAIRFAGLLIFAVIAAAVATRAFRAYQRSI